MRMRFSIAVGVVAVALTVPAFATDDASAPPISCGSGIPGGINCFVSKTELKDARNAFKAGVKLRDQQRLEEALSRFDEASRLAPQNMQFLTAREVVKSQLVFNHIEHGNLLMLENERGRAAAEFRAALDLDTDNQFARERLADAIREIAPAMPRAWPVRVADSVEIHVEPKGGSATFHYSGDVRGLFSELSAAFGVTAQFDDSVQARQVRFNVDDVDFLTALKLACKVSKTMWAALDTHQVLIAADNPENHKQFDRMSLRTFALPPHSTPQEVTDLVSTMRTIFDLNLMSLGQTADQIEVRGPQAALEAASRLLEQLGNQRPQVMLDVRVYQIDHQLTRNIGVHIPNTFNMYNIPAVALAGLGGQSITGSHQPVNCIGRHQSGGQFGAFWTPGATRRPAELHFQPASGDIWWRPHVHGTESRPAFSRLIAQRIMGAQPGEHDYARRPGQ